MAHHRNTHRPNAARFARLVRCPDCQGRFTAALSCERCGFQVHTTDDGIFVVRSEHLHHDSGHEARIREQQYLGDEGHALSNFDRAEVVPHVESMRLTRRRRPPVVLELGAGSGRYTLPLARRAGVIVAVDFSLEGLRRISERLPSARPACGRAEVILVQADISRLHVAPGRFDAALSTLTSNLPSRELRSAMFRLAHTGLKSGGRFVFGAHHWGRRRVPPKEGRYHNGIYRYFMTASELRREAASHFRRVSMRPVKIIPPGATRLRLPLYPVSRVLEYVPGLRDFGCIVMGVATKSRRRVPECPQRRRIR